MHSKDFLAQELREAGLTEMASLAADGYYHDYLSPLALPELQLDADLAQAGTAPALALRRRLHLGEFDATKEESDTWAQSEEGQRTFQKLVNRK